MMAHGISLRSLAKNERPHATRATARRLLGYLAPHRAELARSMVWLIIASSANAAGPAITGAIIDRAVSAAESGTGASVVLAPAMGLMMAATVAWRAQRAQILSLGTVGQKALFAVRNQVFSKLQELSVAFFDDTESGDLMSRLINDIETLNSFLTGGFRRLLSASLSIVATLTGMLLVDARLALATLLAVPIILLTTRAFGLVARSAFRRRQEAIGEVSTTLAEELGGIRIAQAFDRTDRNRKEFSWRNAANRDANISASAISSAFSPVLATISATATALIAWYGSTLAIEGSVSVGVVVAFFAYAGTFFNAIGQLSSLYTETQSALAGGERVFELLDRHPVIVDAPDAMTLDTVSGDVAFRKVSFTYRTGPEILHDIDLDIAAGTTVAIVGPTGAGKTTLVNLIPRFHDPTTGTVALDGIDLRHIATRSLRSHLGVVLQEPFLFNDTLLANIRYGRPDATDDEVKAAARVARADTVADSLEDGYRTSIGERGDRLSTGQRQLVSLARAILADPAVLILDEATSSVDTLTEDLIRTALREVLRDRTALVIAHRLSTVRDADRVVGVEAGRIVEDGTYDALAHAGGLLTRLLDAQGTLDGLA